MTKPPKQPPTPPAAPTDPELVTAIQASGYPLEMALYDEFDKGGMDPALGLIMRLRDPVGDGTSTHEIDLMARVGHHGAVGPAVCHAGVTAWIDAKQLHHPARFVGILGVQPNQHERRVNRSFYSGCPSFQVLDRPDPNTQMFLGPGGFSEALDPLSTGPLCIHWGIAKPDGNGVWKVSGDGSQPAQGFKEDRFYQSMNKLVAAVVWHERDASEFFENGIDPNLSPMPSVAIQCPTLIVDTPTLVLYDVRKQSVSHVDWFMLRWGAEINGKVHYRIIDIVTRAGVPDMIARYKATSDPLLSALHKHVQALHEAGRKLRVASLTGPMKVCLNE